MSGLAYFILGIGVGLSSALAVHFYFKGSDAHIHMVT